VIPKRGPASAFTLCEAPDVYDTMAKTGPAKFAQEVRAEAAKVSWPTRRETVVTTIMVFIFAVIAAIFFLIVDWVIRFGVTFVLGIGS
jgi:preprotein translocase subunit SecE